MVTKKKKGTAIDVLCANVESEVFEHLPIFERGKIKSPRKIEKIARAKAEEKGLKFIEASVEYVTLVYTMEDEEFYANAKEEIE